MQESHTNGNRPASGDEPDEENEMTAATEANWIEEEDGAVRPTETSLVPGSYFLRLAGEFEFIGDAAWARRANPIHFFARNAIQAGFVLALWMNSFAWFGALVAAYFLSWRFLPRAPMGGPGLFGRMAEGERIWIREGSRLAREKNLLLGFALSPQFYVCWGVYFAGVLGYFAWYHYPASTLALFLIIAWYKGVFAWWAVKIADERAAELAAPREADVFPAAPPVQSESEKN